jgi:hypothetical protein
MPFPKPMYPPAQLVWWVVQGAEADSLVRGALGGGHALWKLVPPALGHDPACLLWDIHNTK